MRFDRRSLARTCGTGLTSLIKPAKREGKPTEPPLHENGWTPEKIAEAALTWCQPISWTAWACGECHATLNVLSGPGFFCPRCKHFNILPWSNHIIPFDRPDYGPSRATLRRGYELAARVVEAKRQFKIGHSVRVVRKMGGTGWLAQPLDGTVVSLDGLLMTLHGCQLYTVQVGEQQLRCLQDDLEAA